LKNPKLIRIVVIIVFVVGSYLAKQNLDLGSLTKPKNETSSSSTESSQKSTATVEALFASKTSDTVIEVDGRVKKKLRDDLEGSKHQKFIMKLHSGHTVLVSHNISLAPRVPIREGDLVEIRGEYEWTEQGGVLHWTHHDPGGRRPGGWIKHKGRMYK
jgi:hypothetical protein